ncbi:right-handed parallel beta-helix repeat-containing protein [bacterium]|nr:right-handed parallel beta-helix repeat-containing protein [candidate division CSSED10-310 bacterium]
MLLIASVARAATVHVPAEQPTLQAGIDAADHGDTVLVADGTYKGPGNRGIDVHGKAITVASENGPEHCVINCESQDRAFLFDDAETGACRVQGFTIRNGYRSGDDGSGGAIQCYEASPTILECVFEFNEATNGAAIWCTRGSTACVEDCIFRNNEGTDGGGICVSAHSNPWIHDCLFSANECTNGGGIFCGEYSAPSISCCVFDDCHATNGGAIACDNGSDPLVVNCLMTNCGATNGGGVYCSDSSPSIVACTIADNLGTIAPGIFSLSSNPAVTCSIIWNGGWEEISGNCQVTHSDILGGWAGTGNFDEDPLFAIGPNGGYYLSHLAAGQTAESPCIDAGAMAAAAVCATLPTGTVCLDSLSTSTAGSTDQAIVDLGYHYPAVIPAAVTLWMPATYFEPGNDCSCLATVSNFTGAAITGHPLFVILDVFGVYYFAPGFSGFEHYSMNFPAGETSVTVLGTFTWPEGAGSANGLTWYGALTNPEVTALYGMMGTWTFGFGE